MEYARQAIEFSNSNVDHFYDEKINEIVDIIDYISGNDELNKIEKIWKLCNKDGNQVVTAMKRMVHIHEDLSLKLPKESFLNLIHKREYLKPPVRKLIESICSRLDSSIHIAFKRVKPINETDFNDKVSAILNTEKDKYEREYPSVTFDIARVVPDHSKCSHGLLIESKYIRDSTTLSRVTKGIAADITKYPDCCHILFIIYDPNRAIVQDDLFKTDIESKRKNRCTVHIIR